MALAAHRDADPELDGRLGEPGLTALVAPKAGVQLQMDVWPFEVPLYLLASQYAPYTDMPLPIGEHVVIVDPSTERTVLDGLGALGAIDFCVYEPSMIEAAAS